MRRPRAAPMVRPVIRVIVIDDHQAIRAGLVALLRQEPGLHPAATAATAEQALQRMGEEDFDVAMVDYHLPDGTGVELCRAARGRARGVIYSAFPSEALVVAAMVAGAHGVVSKAAPTEELFDAVRTAAKGGHVFPALSPDVAAAAARRLDEDQLPILGMALDHTSPDEMAAALRVGKDELDARIDAMLSALAPRPGAVYY